MARAPPGHLNHGICRANPCAANRTARPGQPVLAEGRLWQSGRAESKVARRERIERICAEWCRPFGGLAVLQPAELALLRTAAELSLHCPRRHEDAIRCANTISRIMAQ